ncbi:MAG: 3-hydroxyacyl-CoA dehydrogenase family protein [Terriglobia bacterium]
MREIRNVLIYGYGVMGRGVTKTFARSGYRTIVKSRREIGRADLPAGVDSVATLPSQAPDLIIELAPEDVAIKRAVYAEIEAAYPGEDVVIATGTSGLDLVELAEGMQWPQNFIGLHYFMPADQSLVVEVMAGPAASHELVDSTAQVMLNTGKEPVRLYRPVVGFLLNRLQHAILHEAYYLLSEGVANVEAIDLAAKRLLAPRMCVNGLIQQKDIGGLAVHAQAQRSIVPKLYHNGTPSPMLQAMVRRGETGLDAGKGFYDWNGRSAEAVRRQASARLKKLMDFIDSELHSSMPETCAELPTGGGNTNSPAAHSGGR